MERMDSYDPASDRRTQARQAPPNPRISLAEGIQLRLVQLQALAYKEFCVLVKREWLGSLVRILVPSLIITGLLFIVLLQPSFSTELHPDSYDVSYVPKCTTLNDDGDCVTLLYNINGELSQPSWNYYFPDDLDSNQWYDGWYDEKVDATEMKEAGEHTPRSGLWAMGDYLLGIHHPQQSEAARRAAAEKQSAAKQPSSKKILASVPPTREFADAVMQLLCDNNGDTELVMNEDVQFTNLADNNLRGNLYKGRNANSTLGVVEFLPITTDADGHVTVNYRIMYNGTVNNSYKITGARTQYYTNNIRYNIEAALERSLMMYFAENEPGIPFNSPDLTIGFKSFPSSAAAYAQTLLWMLAVSVVLVVVGVNYLYAQVNMSADKETGRRGQMKLAGLRDSVYWVACIARQSVFCIVSMSLAVLIGWLAPSFLMFHNAPYLAIVFILSCFVMYLCAFASLVSVLLKTRKMAIVCSSLAFGMFLVAVFLMSFFSGGLLFFFYGHFLFINIGTLTCALFPPFMFAVVFSEILLNTVPNTLSVECFGGTYVANGFTWSMFFSNPVPNVTDTSDACLMNVTAPFWLMIILILETAFFYFLAYWFDKIRADDNKASLPFFFFLMPSYWFQSKEPALENTSSALVIEHLTKTYKKGVFSSDGVTAIRPFQMQVDGDSIFCLLGPNGAGKTTIIGCLTGLVPPTEGDAYIFGYSVTSNMDAIRSMMGVCPQFDMLFDNLSAWEHMRIVNWMKRPCDRMTTDELRERLEDVRLTKVAHQATKTYSGGMKRRLSVVLSTVGNPRVIFLDEPSTGMDPGNRRYVWDLVRKIKKNTLIVLTTHSMEEADMLGDQIAIVAAGKLRCEGSPLELKGRFGLGYRLTISCDPKNTDEVKRLVNRHLPGGQLRGDNAGALVYSLPDLDGSSSEFFELLQSSMDEDGNLLVSDWGCQNTTMEDVFLTVTRKIMGQDITFDANNKRSQLDRDEREIFKESSQRFERRIRYLKEEVAELREMLAEAGLDANAVLSAMDREEQLMIEAEAQ